MISTILAFLLLPIALSVVLLLGYGVFLSWVVLFAICGNKWCQKYWGEL